MAASAALQQRLDLFEVIADDAKRALLRIAEEEVLVEKGEKIREAGGPAQEFWCVTDGWFYSSSTLSDGGRQVHAFHLPGDIMGLPDLGWEVAVCDVTAATKGSIIRMEKQAFRQVVLDHPPLAGFFLTFGIYDHTRLIDQLRVVGRMPAIKRVGHLLLQLADEQAEPITMREVANDADGQLFLPIDQSLIGDAVGLTNISVSRMMTELEAKGYIRRAGRTITFPRLAELKAFCDYTERQRSVPLSWMLQAEC